jgi:hypothetical protein
MHRGPIHRAAGADEGVRRYTICRYTILPDETFLE